MTFEKQLEYVRKNGCRDGFIYGFMVGGPAAMAMVLLLKWVRG